VRRQVEQHARHEGLDVVDVVPGRLGVEAAMALLRVVDPRTFRKRRLALGATAGTAVVVSTGVEKRLGMASESHGPLRGPGDLHRRSAQYKRYAPATTDLVVVDGLAARRLTPAETKALMRARFGAVWPLAIVIPAGLYVLLGVGIAVTWLWGLVALACWCVQPVLTFAGTPIRPVDLWYRPLLRWLLGPIELVRIATARSKDETVATSSNRVDARALRPVYEELLAGGLDRFFEAPRPDCPLCGSHRLEVEVRTPDLLQRKPGEFVLTRCEDCSHVFQNPRLSLEGLDFYYKDFYDGLGEEQLELVFGSSDTSYRGRAAMLDGRHQPRRWLDVGAGHGHFCLIAAEHWPDTCFDGLDMSASIEEAAHRGWVQRGIRGMFPEVAGELTGHYDVVSMHHYLEHTRDPMAELDAALDVLEPGGYLLIELPDPDSIYGRLLGKYWVPWFQPQHQHLLSLGNLEKAVRARGMSVEATERGVASQPVDLLFGVWLLVNRLAPAPDLPWRPPSRWYDHLRRDVVFVAALPFFLLAFLCDQVLALVIRRRRRSNTYRLLARSALLPEPVVSGPVQAR
jgi:SAM-dependent methyltransferase